MPTLTVSNSNVLNISLAEQDGEIFITAIEPDGTGRILLHLFNNDDYQLVYHTEPGLPEDSFYAVDFEGALEYEDIEEEVA